MRDRQNDRVPQAAAKARFSAATDYPPVQDPRLHSQNGPPRGFRRPGRLTAVFEAEAAPLLKAALGLQVVAVFGVPVPGVQ